MLILLLVFCWIHSSDGVSCLDGWKVSFTNPDKCIKAFGELKTWHDAHQFCVAQGGSLVSIHNAFENTEIATLAAQAYSACHYWIGLHDFDDTGVYNWTDESTVEYVNWQQGYPLQVPGGTVGYLDLRVRNQWAATSDIAFRSCFVCEVMAGAETTEETYCPNGWEHYVNSSGKCIKGFMERITWMKAHESCEKLAPLAGSNLVAIHSEQQNQQVGDIAAKTENDSYVWIGLNGLMEPSNYSWTDGSPYDYSHWFGGSVPATDAGGTATYLVNPHDPYSWMTDKALSHKYGYICEQNSQPLRCQCPDGWSFFYGSGNKCIRGFHQERNFSDAQHFCENQPDGQIGNLVSIHSSYQNLQVASIAQATYVSCLYWIGLSTSDASSGYRWIDGSNVNYTHWAEGNPGELKPGGFAYISLSERLRWLASYDADETNCFVCQTTILGIS